MTGTPQRPEHCTSDGRITPRCGRLRCPKIGECAANISKVGHTELGIRVPVNRRSRKPYIGDPGSRFRGPHYTDIFNQW